MRGVPTSPILTRDFLIHEYVELRKSSIVIGKEAGFNTTTVLGALKRHGIVVRKRGWGSNECLTGKKFGKLLVVGEPITTMIESATRRRYETKWGCKCDCGKSVSVACKQLTSGRTISCGCARVDAGLRARKLSGLIPSSLWYSIKYGAMERNMKFDITVSYIESLFVAQEGLCALSGRHITLPPPAAATGDLQMYSASLDRIDSRVGYLEGNLQWVHKDINRIKHSLDQDYFIDLCKSVVEHQRQKQCQTSEKITQQAI